MLPLAPASIAIKPGTSSKRSGEVYTCLNLGSPNILVFEYSEARYATRTMGNRYSDDNHPVTRLKLRLQSLRGRRELQFEQQDQRLLLGPASPPFAIQGRRAPPPIEI
jgi:hypothetical protein